MKKQLLLSKFNAGGRLEATRESVGRKFGIRKDLYRYRAICGGGFLEDEIKISASKALNRLPWKMQVFSAPLNNHITNRRSHTDMVVSIAVQVAYTLGLNINLCRAGALGHDVGHCPYGPHGGEILGISHPLNGVHVLQEVEGLNLTKEVVQAILYHSLDKDNLDNGQKLSNEIFTIAIADKFAYLFKDILDIKATGLLDSLGLTLPKDLNLFGFGRENFQSRAIGICVNALVEESLSEGKVSFSKSETAAAFQKIRKWLYDNVYNKLNDRPERAYHKTNLKVVMEYFVDHDLTGSLAPEFAISLMTDRDVDWFVPILQNGNPTPAQKEQIEQLSVREIIRSLNGKEIDHNASPLW